jgi:hypothetical protein
VTSHFPAIVDDDDDGRRDPAAVQGSLFHLAPRNGAVRTEVGGQGSSGVSSGDLKEPKIRCVAAVVTLSTPKMLEDFVRSFEYYAGFNPLAWSWGCMECIVSYLLEWNYLGEDMGVQELDEVHDAVEEMGFDLKGGWKEEDVLFVDLVRREENWCDPETEDDLLTESW